MRGIWPFLVLRLRQSDSPRKTVHIDVVNSWGIRNFASDMLRSVLGFRSTFNEGSIGPENGSARPLVAFLGLPGPSWVSLGLPGPSWAFLAFLGLPGPSWAFLNLSGL